MHWKPAFLQSKIFTYTDKQSRHQGVCLGVAKCLATAAPALKKRVVEQMGGGGVGIRKKNPDLNNYFGQNYHNRPYALTSHLHNNDAMLGVKTCRAARTCCAGRVLALSRCAGPGRPGSMAFRGWPAGCLCWRRRTRQCLVWPPNTRGRPSVTSCA